MAINHSQKHKVRKDAHERYQNFSEKEKEKSEKRPQTDIKIFLKKKEKKSADGNKSLSEEEIKKRKLSI